MIPPPRRRICGSAAWARDRGARRLMAIIRSHSSGWISETLRSNMIPALLTRTSMPPNCWAACSTTREIADESLTSGLDAEHPWVLLQFRVQLPALDDRHLGAFFKEAIDNSSAYPLSPPVTRAILPSSCIVLPIWSSNAGSCLSLHPVAHFAHAAHISDKFVSRREEALAYPADSYSRRSPVKMTSPGSSGVTLDKREMISETGKTMSAVLPFCTSSPLIAQPKSMLSGSSNSSGVASSDRPDRIRGTT
jgi:hypothetical protein